MDVIIDDEPLGEREDRPRSHTWPLPQPPTIEASLEKIVEDEPSCSVNNNEAETLKPEVSPRKNTRKNAWGNLSYADLITQAIQSSSEQRLTLSQVYEWMVKNIPYFNDKGDSTSSAGWKNSIRHNLSLHSRFKRIQNDQNGKSSYWVLNPDAKPGKATRRRSGSVDGVQKSEKKRGRSKKNTAALSEEASLSPASSSGLSRSQRMLAASGSPCNIATSPSSSTDSLSNLHEYEESYGPFSYCSDNFSRPRSQSNVSTQSSVGRLSPIPGDEFEEDLPTVSSPYINAMDRCDPRGVSLIAEETASLVECMTLGRQNSETINLDDSLKFEAQLLRNGGATSTGNRSVNFSTNPDNLRRIHSDSFSSVQSADSGYESPAYFSSPNQQQNNTSIPVMSHSMPQQQRLSSGVTNKPPPPYTVPSFNNYCPQPMMTGQTNPMMQENNGFYQAAQQQQQMQPTTNGYTPLTQQLQRLQHPPLAPSGSYPTTRVTSSGYTKVASMNNRPNMTSYADPYINNMKDSRNNNIAFGGNSVQSSSAPSTPTPGMCRIESASRPNDALTMPLINPFPSDLSHVELDSFNDQFQLARDLESIIRSELGDCNTTPMDFAVDQQQQQQQHQFAASTANGYHRSYIPPTPASNVYPVSVNGQGWVH